MHHMESPAQGIQRIGWTQFQGITSGGLGDDSLLALKAPEPTFKKAIMMVCTPQIAEILAEGSMELMAS